MFLRLLNNTVRVVYRQTKRNNKVFSFTEKKTDPWAVGAVVSLIVGLGLNYVSERQKRVYVRTHHEQEVLALKGHLENLHESQSREWLRSKKELLLAVPEQTQQRLIMFMEHTLADAAPVAYFGSSQYNVTHEEATPATPAQSQ